MIQRGMGSVMDDEEGADSQSSKSGPRSRPPEVFPSKDPLHLT